MSYFLYKRHRKHIGIRYNTLKRNKTYIARANNISPRIQGYMLFIFKFYQNIYIRVCALIMQMRFEQ